MSAEITSARTAGDAPLCDAPLCDLPLCDSPPCGASAEERGSLGTLSWQRVVRVASLAAAVAALAATSVAAGHMVRVVGPPTRAPNTSVISIQRAPGP